MCGVWRAVCGVRCAVCGVRMHTNMCSAVLTCMGMSAVNEARQKWASGKKGDIYACIIAEVKMVPQNGKTGPDPHAQSVFVSPELYVCSERKLRKQCTSACRPVLPTWQAK